MLVIPEKKELKNISIGMGLMDFIPVLLFAVSMFLLARIYPSPLFYVGAVLCILAGVGKVLWKLLLAITRKNIKFLNKQLRIVLPAGFLLMIISLILGRGKVSFPGMWALVKAFPGRYAFGFSILGFTAMGILGVNLDATKKRSQWIEQSVNTVAQLSLLFGVFLCYAKMTSYAPSEEAIRQMDGSETTSVLDIDEGYLFDGPGSDVALVFYPGAMVDCRSYSPLLQKISGEGVDVFLVEMPYNLALFDVNAMDRLRENYDYEHWYLCGHSLGGAMAANYIAKAEQEPDGLILLAAYATKELQAEDLKVLSLYGDRDGVLNVKKVEEGRTNMPTDYKEAVIPGGNHAQFGSYGPQKGDGEATIPAEIQLQITADAIIEFLK